jgi:hypothetical protein
VATISSSYSASATATLPGDSFWLSDPLDVTRSRAVDVPPGWQPNEVVTGGVFAPRGRSHHVVLAGDTYGIVTSLPLRTLSKAAYDAVMTMLKSKRTLLLRSPLGERFFIRVAPGQITREQIRAQKTTGEPYPVRHAHRIAVSVVEVEEP